MEKFTSKISGLISEPLNNIGYEIVRIKFIEVDKTHTLEIMIEHKNESQNITINDCKKASKLISIILEDVNDYQYTLEVSSPGIDRPLIKLKDFEKYKDFDVKFFTTENILNSKKFEAKIIDVQDSKIKVMMINNSQEAIIEFSLIESARLVLNDHLIKARNKKS